ncbi:hypothetical protein IWX90DRAFT_249507 [Phyllosticta citrichinensis]|uniref:Uncharacterized protein n=1 Tax=Phyllosticta citrichinensis TaxID=1130410 RepID=A0ABR1XRG0_9PEZI
MTGEKRSSNDSQHTSAQTRRGEVSGRRPVDGGEIFAGHAPDSSSIISSRRQGTRPARHENYDGFSSVHTYLHTGLFPIGPQDRPWTRGGGKEGFSGLPACLPACLPVSSWRRRRARKEPEAAVIMSEGPQADSTAHWNHVPSLRHRLFVDVAWLLTISSCNNLGTPPPKSSPEAAALSTSLYQGVPCWNLDQQLLRRPDRCARSVDDRWLYNLPTLWRLFPDGLRSGRRLPR